MLTSARRKETAAAFSTQHRAIAAKVAAGFQGRIVEKDRMKSAAGNLVLWHYEGLDSVGRIAWMELLRWRPLGA